MGEDLKALQCGGSDYSYLLEDEATNIIQLHLHKLTMVRPRVGLFVIKTINYIYTKLF